MRLRGDSTVVATAILLAATMSLGITLLLYAHNIAKPDVKTKGCIPSLLAGNDTILVYNPCSYDVNVTLIPKHAYHIVIGNESLASDSFTLHPLDAALIQGTPRALLANGYLIPVQR